MDAMTARFITVRILTRICRRLPVVLAVILAAALSVRADEPYARSRDYDLQHSKIVLRFDVDQKKVIGEVTHTLSVLRNNTSSIAFDSARPRPRPCRRRPSSSRSTRRPRPSSRG